MTFPNDLTALIETTKGFMPAHEGMALYENAKEFFTGGVGVEIGSYCGKSTLYLGQAARETNSHLVTIDHHRGSEEHQIGWEYHDLELADDHGVIDTFAVLRATIAQSKLTNSISAIVGRSATIAKWWSKELDLVFIDGSHTEESARTDYESWSPFIRTGGALIIHDVFPDPNAGGQAPYLIYKMAIDSNNFVETFALDSLRVLRRI